MPAALHHVPGSSLPDDDRRALGQALLGAGLVVLSVGLALCGYSVVAAGFESQARYGGGTGLDTGLLVVGLIGVAGGALVAATGALVGNTLGRPRGRRTFGAYPEIDADDDW